MVATDSIARWREAIGDESKISIASISIVAQNTVVRGLKILREGIKLPYEAGAILKSLTGFRCRSSSRGAVGYIPFGPSRGTAAGSGSDLGSFAVTNNLICRQGIARHTGVRGITTWSTSLEHTAGRVTEGCFTVGVLAMVQKPEIALVAAG
jgi:hypothetical protein